MSAIFLKILNLSYSASFLILAIVAARIVLKKAPKWVFCLLWALVALRLIIPFTLESALSLLPSNEVIPTDIATTNTPYIQSGFYAVNSTVNPVIETTLAPNPAASINPMQTIVDIACYVWIAGVIVMAVYALASYLKIRRSVRESVRIQKGVKECDEVKSPFILGILRPMIYVPSGIENDTLELVLAHERAHLHRRDHLWKPLGFLLLSVYWFNPLSWVAYVLLCRDIESACDERVIRNRSSEYMAAYSQALLDCSVQRRRIAACPVAFGETGVKMRIKNVLNYKKPAFWIIIAALVTCVVIAVCFLTNPEKKEEEVLEEPAVAANDTVDGAPYVFDEQRVYYYSGNINEAGVPMINFSITFDPSGKYTWYETPFSSTIGMGTYEIKDGILTMTDDAELMGMERVNTFAVQGMTLTYMARSSDNFIYVHLEDGETFELGVNPIGDNPYSVIELDPAVFVWPTNQVLITHGFSGEDFAYHPETDFAGQIGDPVYAITLGTITETGFDNEKGNYIVENIAEVTFTYSHLDEVMVSEGNLVEAGQQIGTIGNTGNSTGPHLGLKVEISGEPKDFLEILSTQGAQTTNLYQTGEGPDGETKTVSYASNGTTCLIQDYFSMTSVILDGDLEIPVILSMGVGESFIEKMDLNKDGVEEYVIAECEKASGGTLYYGLCVVREINGHYSLTRYDSNYFLEYFRENTRFNYEEDTGKFWMIEVVPAFQSRCTTGSFKTNRKESPVAIEYTGGLYVDFEDDDVVISAPVGLVYSDNPVPDYSDGIMSRCMAYCMADHSLITYLISFASAE